MYRVSARFKNELKKPIHTIRVKMEVLSNPGLQIIEGGEIYGTGQLDVPTNHLVDGVIDVNTDRSTRRTFTATVLNTDGQFAPGEDWGGMFYVNRAVRLYRGIQMGDTLATTEWVCVGTFLLDNVDIVVERNISIAVMSGSDFWKKFAKGELAENHKYDAGTHANQIIRIVADKCGVDALNLDPLSSRQEADTKLQKDRSFDNQSKYGELLEKISDMFSIDIYFDVWGVLTTEDTQTSADKSPVWIFEPGDSIISLLRSSYNDDILFNGVKIIGTGDKKNTVISVIYDNDPQSKVNIERIGRRTIRKETEDVETQEQADRLARRTFNRRCGRIRNELNIEGVCIPFFEGDDVVRVVEGNFSNTNARARLVSFTVPLTSSRQTLKARRIVRVETLPTPVVGPVISGVEATSVSTTSAIISWDVSGLSNGQVEFGPTTAYESVSQLVSTYQSSHAIQLLRIQPDTLYHFRVRSTNQQGGTTISADYTFTTEPLPVLPVISTVGVSVTTNSATVSWSISLPANGYIEYGTTTAYGSQTTLETALLLGHTQIISGLASDTHYEYRIHSEDGDSQEVTYADSFQTAVIPTPSTVGPRTTPSTPTGSYVYTINVGDTTGTLEARGALQAFIDNVPNGTSGQHNIIVFPAGATYRFYGDGLYISGRAYLDFWVYGATLRNSMNGASLTGSAFRVHNTAHDIKIQGGTIRGSNPAVRTYNQYRNGGGESSCGVHVVNGSYNVVVEDVYIYDQYGHGFYEAYQGAMPHDLTVQYCRVDGMGVMGLVVGGGTDITFQWNYIKDTAIGPIDIEDAATGQVCNDIVISDNEIDGWSWDTHYDNGCIAQMTNFSLGNRPTINGLTIERNTIHNGPIVGGVSWSTGLNEQMSEGFTFAQPGMANGYGHAISVGPLGYNAGYISNIVIRDNIIDDSPSGYGIVPVNNSYVRAGAYIFVGYANNVEVTGNTCSGGSGVVVQTLSCTGTIVTSPNP